MRRYFKLNRWRVLLLAVFVLAACETTPAQPTATPTRTLSGPTLAPSPTVLPFPPTEIPLEDTFDGLSDPTAAALPRDSSLPPLAVGIEESGAQMVQLALEAGVLLTGDLYQQGTERLPGVLIIGRDRLAWGSFPAQLQQFGFTVFVIELRDPTNVNDFRVMIDGLNTGLADPNHLAVIGAGVGADLALRGCAVDARCDALVLLSPTDIEALPDLMPQYSPRPIFISASSEDTTSYELAQLLDTAASGEKFFQPLDGAGSGEQMLQNRPDLAGLIASWLTRQLGI
ncbi:MAG: hypothetical protein D6737_20045 [Chloroflexi bacterium]|nr:MAG: hypothetical protein D6737_20045 [Chloroflexota bacterium]